ncbi:MAG: ribosome-associated translation inhibitor RaiA [Melioribacteraceae bacterium]|jgi:putative sigma-54 modulation protein|nr:ribosome-associated translation inhibitor RaiA [Melioribacteraceae bacterium]
MNIQITSRKFRAKDSLKDYIKEEIKRLERYNDKIMDVSVVLSFTHFTDSIKTVEMTLKVPGKIISVSTESEEFEKSVSGAIEKSIRQLKKIKTMRIARKKS